MTPFLAIKESVRVKIIMRLKIEIRFFFFFKKDRNVDKDKSMTGKKTEPCVWSVCILMNVVLVPQIRHVRKGSCDQPPDSLHFFHKLTEQTLSF